jgi:hypothetical protein
MRRKPSEFATTETELKATVAPSNVGLSRLPENGYSTPAAAGIEMVL